MINQDVTIIKTNNENDLFHPGSNTQGSLQSCIKTVLCITSTPSPQKKADVFYVLTGQFLS